MKSSNPSFSRRALIAAAVVLATGSLSALAQNANENTPSNPNSGTNYENTNPSATQSSSNANSSSMNQNSSAENTDMSENTNRTSNATTNTNANEKLSWSDRHFVTKTAKGNADEIKLAQLAASRATNPDVKNFAQQLVNDHTKMGQDLQTLASNKGVDLSKEESKEENSEGHDYKKLSKASGADFDHQFVEHMVSEHKKDIKAFKDRADDSKDADLKSFAQSQIPTLEHHLQIAQQLQSSATPTGRTGNDSYRPASDSTTSSATENSSTSAPANNDTMNSGTSNATSSATPSTTK